MSSTAGSAACRPHDHEEDYAAFERVVTETLRVAPIRICAFCWMPNRWHFGRRARSIAGRLAAAGAFRLVRAS